MRLLDIFNTHLNSRLLQLSKWFSYLFVLSYFQPLERRCSLTKGVRETLIYLAWIFFVQYTRELCENIFWRRDCILSPAPLTTIILGPSQYKNNAWNTNSVWESVFASTYRYWKATIKVLLSLGREMAQWSERSPPSLVALVRYHPVIL